MAMAKQSKAEKQQQEETPQEQNQSDNQSQPTKYQVPEKEKHLVHVRLQRVGRDERSGKLLNKPFIAKYAVQNWESNVSKNLKNLGFADFDDPNYQDSPSEILYHPNKA